MSEKIDHHRRRFLSTTAMTMVAAHLERMGVARANSNDTNSTALLAVKPATNMSFGSLKQIDAGLLNIGYGETGPPDGPPVILLHGWPYDIHTWAG